MSIINPMSSFKITFVEGDIATACSKCAFRLSDPYENEQRTICAFDLMKDKCDNLHCRTFNEGGRTDGKNGYFTINQEGVAND